MIRSFLLTLLFSLPSFAQLEPTSRLSENLKRVPGVQRYSVRGSENGERILLLYRGIPLVSPRLLPQELTESIEVSPSPESVRYGSDAMSGVYTFIPSESRTSLGVFTGPRTNFAHGFLAAPFQASALVGPHFARYLVGAKQKLGTLTFTEDLIAAGKEDDWQTLGSLSLDQRLSRTDSLFLRSTLQSVDEKYLWNSLVYTHDFAKLLVDWKYTTVKGLTQNELEYGAVFQLPTEGWMIEPGFRYLVHSEQVLTSLTASHQTKDRKWVRYSEGGRSPNIEDSFTNPSLRPEQVNTIELGYLRKPEMESVLNRDGASYGLTAFSSHYFRFIKDGTNRGEVTVEGFELLAGYTYSVWRAQATTQFLKPQFIFTHDELRNTPHQSYTLLLGSQLGPAVFEVQHVYWSKESPLKIWDFSVRTSSLTNWNGRAVVRDLTSQAPEYFLAAQRYF